MPPPKHRKRKSELELLMESAPGTSSLTDTKRQKRLPVRAKDDEIDATDVTTSPKGKVSTVRQTPAKGTLKVFGEDDEEDLPVPSIIPEPKQSANEVIEDSEDDDDAPEAVSTHQSAADVKQSTKAAQKVALEQAAARKLKRQQRDALFTQQAEGRKKAEEKATSSIVGQPEQQDLSPQAARQLDSASGRRRMDKLQIPSVLPAEFLQDSSSEDDEQDLGGADIKLAKRNVSAIEKQLARQDRAPRDERIGSTVYRVAKKTDERMAPKAKKHAKSSKDVLLKRNRTTAKSGSGFFGKR